MGCLIGGVIGLVLVGPLVAINLIIQEKARRKGRGILAGAPASAAAIQEVINDLSSAEDHEAREIVARLMDRL